MVGQISFLTTSWCEQSHEGKNPEDNLQCLEIAKFIFWTSVHQENGPIFELCVD